MTSAWSITAAAGAPRGAFVGYPLGHTTGKPHDPVGQRRIVAGALAAFATITEPATIVDLGEEWGDDAWRAKPLGGAALTAPSHDGGGDGNAAAGGNGGDSRTERFDTPQYQTEDDRLAAEARVGSDVACRACVGFDA